MVRILCQVIGGTLCLIGLLPIPFGMILFAIGLLFLIPTTPWVTRLIRKARYKFASFDRAMDAMTRRAPAPYKRVLRRTEIGNFDW